MKKAAPSPGEGGYTAVELAELLTRCGLGTISAAMIDADLAAGAPLAGRAAESGGEGLRLHPLSYAAWLLKRGDDAG